MTPRGVESPPSKEMSHSADDPEGTSGCREEVSWLIAPLRPTVIIGGRLVSDEYAAPPELVVPRSLLTK